MRAEVTGTPKQPAGQTIWPVVLSRSLAAVFGGYAVTYCATAFMAVYLSMSPVNNVFVAGMLSFAVYTAAVLYAFSARNHKQVWLKFIVIAALLSMAAFLPDMSGVAA